MPDQNVIFQQSNNAGNGLQSDPLDPFSRVNSLPQGIAVAQAVPPLVVPAVVAQPASLVGSPPPNAPPLSPPPPPPPPPISPIAKILGLPLWIKLVVGGGIALLFMILIMASFQGKKTTQKPVTLTYWGLWESKNTMDQLFAEFHRQYPNITVVVSEEDPKHYNERLLTRIRNGTGPDSFIYHNSWVPELRPVLSPLSTEAMTVAEFTKIFYPVAQKDLITNGAIYGIPLGIDTLSLFSNNSILKAAGVSAPTTWEAFNAIAATTTVKEKSGKIKTSGAAMGTYDNVTHASDILAMLLVQNGANIRNLASTANHAGDALRFYTSFGLSDNAVWDSTLSPSLVSFAQGNLGLYFGYSYDIFAIRVMNPTLDFSVYPVPHLPNRPMTIASYWVQGVSLYSKHQKEAMLLMRFLAKKDTEEKFYALQAKTRPFGAPYARVDLAPLLKTDPFVYPFISQASTAISTYFSSNTYDTGITAQMQGYLGNAVRSIFGNTSVDTAVLTLDKGVAQILQQYGVQ